MVNKLIPVSSQPIGNGNGCGPYQSRPGERVRSGILPVVALTYLVPALVATTRQAINVIIRGPLTRGGGEESSIPYDVIGLSYTRIKILHHVPAEHNESMS